MGGKQLFLKVDTISGITFDLIPITDSTTEKALHIKQPKYSVSMLEFKG